MNLKNQGLIINIIDKLYEKMFFKNFSNYKENDIEVFELKTEIKLLRELSFEYIDFVLNENRLDFKAEAFQMIKHFSSLCDKSIRERYRSSYPKKDIYNFIEEANAYINDLFDKGSLETDGRKKSDFQLKLIEKSIKNNDSFILKIVGELKQLLFSCIEYPKSYGTTEVKEIVDRIYDLGDALHWYISIDANKDDIERNKNIVYPLLMEIFLNNIKEQNKININNTKYDDIQNYINLTERNFDQITVTNYAVIFAHLMFNRFSAYENYKQLEDEFVYDINKYIAELTQKEISRRKMLLDANKEAVEKLNERINKEIDKENKGE